MEIIYLEDPKAKSIISKYLANHPLILVGSAISAWEPTRLPVGEDFTKGMFNLLFPSHFLGNNDRNMVKELSESLYDLLVKVPFEHLLERCPNHKKLTPIIKRCFAIDRFNHIHEAIAEALIDEKFQGIITTNYDLCLDKLLANNPIIPRVVEKNDFQSVNVKTQRVYFKIHGSADDKEGETLVWALSHESYLPDWKRKLLSAMIAGRSLLIIGYSGRDFEICPEILKMHAKNIFWNWNIQEKYLFSWHNVPGNDSERLLRSLKNDFDIDWSENAEINKSRNGRIINISNDENSAEIRMDEKKEKAILRISDGRTYELKVKTEEGKLNIYKKDKRANIENQISPNARRFLKELPGYFLVGNMLTLLSQLIRPVKATWGKSSNDLLDSIKKAFTKNEMGIWRASLLNSMGCASIALKASREMLKCSQSKADFVSLRREEAQALYHTGKYYQSAKRFYKAAKECDLNRSLRVALFLDSCDAYRSYGGFLRAFLRLKEARKAIQKITEPEERRQLKGKAALKEVLIWRHLYQITKALKIQFLVNLIQKKAINLLKLASKASLKSGDWFDFQQARFWAERMNIDPLILAYQIPYEPPPPKEGYEHLGYHVAQSMYLRDQLNKARCHLSKEEELSLEEHINTCAMFGNYPELWKLCFIGLKRGTTKKEMVNATVFRKAFFCCEYTLPMRLFRLILGE